MASIMVVCIHTLVHNSSSIIHQTSNIIICLDVIIDSLLVIRNLEGIADADVAELYGVETREVNQAVRNNPDKFPARYMFELSKSELRDLRSKVLTTNVSAKSRSTTKVFTDRGLCINYKDAKHKAYTKTEVLA